MNSKSRSIAVCLMGIFLILAVLAGALLLNNSLPAAAAEPAESIAIDRALYEFEDDNSKNSYSFSTAKRVSAFSNGKSALGTLTVRGTALTESVYNGVQAIGVDAGTSVVFSYKQNVASSIKYSSKTWKLSDEAAQTIAGYSVGTIKSGAVLVLKSKDGIRWESTGAKMVNINGSTFEFAPEGEEIGSGTYYKFLSVNEMYYEYVSGTHTQWVWWPFKKKTVTDYASVYKNFGQESTVYLCSNNPSAVSFTSKATDAYEIKDDELSEEEIEFLAKGKTLTDKSVSFSEISVNDFGNTCFSLSCSYNGGAFESFSSGKVFSEAGAYLFRIRTPLGKTREISLYIVHPGEDLAFSQYFGEGLTDASLRIYDPSKAVPVYMTGKEFSISPASANLPGIYGTVYHFADESALESNTYDVFCTFAGLTEKFTDTLENEGYYIFDLYSSDPAAASGEIAHYSFRLCIQSREDYAPSVNASLIQSTKRNDLFARKVYAVSLPTAGGGCFVYCFPYTTGYYDMAYSLAENIELLSVEDYGSYYFYKSENSNTKQKYTSKAKLFEAIAGFAEKNVDTLYLEANAEYLTQAAEQETLADLSAQSIERDVCVVTDESVKKALQAEEVYLNGFTFLQAADYETDTVMALDEAGHQYRIPYGADAGSIFTSTTRVTITEENWHGRTVYDTIYYAPEENEGSLTLSLSGENVRLDKLSRSTPAGHSVSIAAAGDEYDSQSLLIVTDEAGNREVMLLSEAEGYSFPDEDKAYTLCIVNRFGTELSFTLSVQKAPEQIVFPSDVTDDPLRQEDAGAAPLPNTAEQPDAVPPAEQETPAAEPVQNEAPATETAQNEAPAAETAQNETTQTLSGSVEAEKVQGGIPEAAAQSGGSDAKTIIAASSASGGTALLSAAIAFFLRRRRI